MIKIMKYGDVPADEIFARTEPAVNVEDIVTEIIANVRKNGDAALKEYSAKFDGAVLENIEVTQQEIDAAFEALEPEFVEIINNFLSNRENYIATIIRQRFEKVVVISACESSVRSNSDNRLLFRCS